jgi:hypothetical protein
VDSVDIHRRYEFGVVLSVAKNPYASLMQRSPRNVGTVERGTRRLTPFAYTHYRKAQPTSSPHSSSHQSLLEH